MLPNSITIFTDGSSRGNPGPGGYAAVIVFPDNNRSELKVVPRTSRDGEPAESKSEKFQVKEVGGREAHTTNNRMELQAAIAALSFVTSQLPNFPTSQLVIYSDSSYVIKGITMWIWGWQKNGWITATKKEVENRDLWERLAELTRNYAEQTQNKIQWKQISGHVGVVGNERCDVIAQTYAELTQNDAEKKLQLYSGPLSDYPIKNILDISENSLASVEKSASKKHSNARAYSYVSLVDGKVVTHKTWAECEARVKGKKAKYKKVLSAEEEKALVELWQK